MKTTGVKDIPKFGLLVFLGHPSGNSLISGLSDILNIKYLCSSLTYYRFDINEVYCPFLLTYVEISADVGVQHQHHVPSCPLADGDPGPGGDGGHHVRVL